MIENTDKIKFPQKKDLVKFFVALFILSSTIAYAGYKNPTPSELSAGKTNVVPVYLDNTPQAKNGGLSVEVFTANSNSGLSQDVFFKGKVTGDTSTSTPNIVIGSGTNIVDLRTIGSVAVLSLKIEGQTSSNRQLCSDISGKIIVCGVSPTGILSGNGYSNGDGVSPINYELTWTSTNASICTLSDNVTTRSLVPASGGTINYSDWYFPVSMTCTGPGGSVTVPANVTYIDISG